MTCNQKQSVTFDLKKCVAAVLLCTAAVGAPAQADTLKDAVSSALNSNPEALAVYGNRRVVEQELAQARSGYYPTLDVRLAGGRERTDDPSTRRAGAGDVTLTRHEVALSGRQMLFDGGQVSGDVEQQKSRLESSRARVQEIGESLGLRVTDAYLQMLREQELDRLAQDNVITHRGTLGKTEDRLKSGVGQRADTQQAEGRLALATSTAIARQGNVRDAAARYQRLVGAAPQSLVKPGTPGGVPASLEQAKQTALGAHPTLQVAEREVAAAQAALQGARGRMGPRVDLEMNLGDNRDVDGVVGSNNDASLMLVLRYNLYRGGADKARIAELEQRFGVARDNLASIRRAVEEEVTRAWEALTAARDALASQETHVRASGDVLVSYRAQFDLGRRTLLDVLNAENELFQARSTLVAGQYAVLQNEYRLLAATGGLVRALDLTEKLAAAR